MKTPSFAEGVFACLECSCGHGVESRERLSAQEILQPAKLFAGLVHVIAPRFEVVLVEGAVGFAQIVVHSVL